MNARWIMIDGNTITVEEQMDRLLRIKEACEALGIGHSRLYELIGEGHIRTVKIGERGVRIAASEIDRFIQERMEGR